jgi:molybdate transport system substrate-binding protein
LIAQLFDLLGNRLVLIARPGVETVLPPEVRSSGVELGKGDTADRALRAALGSGPGRTRLALAEVGSVPAGRYARAALEALNLWQPWSSRLAMTDNVRAALLLVARGETDLGIVYASDAQLEPRIRVVATFADSLHPPIRYPAAVLASATHPRALEALEFLAQPAAIKRFLEAGFTAPGPAARP